MKQKFSIEGMNCDHCVAKVEKAVNELTGIEKVKIHLKKKNGVIKFDETLTSTDQIIQKISEAGYQASLA
ncbi:MAG TPA: copper chaperone CopZ [Candidatus Tetragenococcus pullicola]|nr:copper chaperone CopZ [Candidatus Tetragenococcus pullicola]